MTNSDSDLTHGDADLQRLQAVRQKQLSCLFDVDSTLQALSPPTPVKPQVRRGSQPPLAFPNHNPIPVDSTTAALQALGSKGKVRRQKPGGSHRQGQPPLQPAPQSVPQPQVRLPTQAELTAQYGQPQVPLAQPLQPLQEQPLPQEEVSRRVPRRRFTLYSLWRRAKDFAAALPRDFSNELARYVACLVLGSSLKLFAPNPAVVSILLCLAVVTIVLLFLFRPGWRELGLTSSLLLGLCLSKFL